MKMLRGLLCAKQIIYLVFIYVKNTIKIVLPIFELRSRKKKKNMKQPLRNVENRSFFYPYVCSISYFIYVVSANSFSEVQTNFLLQVCVTICP